jgi:hypothetical protein
VGVVIAWLGVTASLITRMLMLSRRMWAPHFGQSIPFHWSVDRLASRAIRMDLQ